ncbi:DNA polymerase Y family protein [Actinophytocola sp.]|uniref:DNA polymerase Y family protein n=1 Tax=Actinophytocola sp. TaxID=1872138 RepID=UPI002D5DC4D9|nr:DNA polymerase Y family protein [Actinophytocola sp.]HYQ67471.1 DNA polymerase Y family protein [Actinophytocola sp.]
MQRTLVVWCPDWPVTAASAAGRLAPHQPVAVVEANRVVACSAPARAEGVRRGMRRRDAQGRCPELVVFPDDPVRDARLFEPVAAAVEELAVGVEIVRPGVVAVPARGPASYFKGEEHAAERLIDQVADRTGAECQVGIADGLFTAILAARRGIIVPPDQSPDFLRPLSVRELDRPAEGHHRADLVDLLRRLGLRTLGAFAELPEKDVSARFGADAVLAHRLARGQQHRPPARRRPPPELTVTEEPDPPIERVDAAAFVARTLAERFHAGLAAHGLACTRLGINATTANGEERTRVWRAAEPLTPTGIADRVRWQLDGWLSGRDQRPSAGIVTLRLEPVEVVEGATLQLDLWRGEGRAEADERAARAMVHVQGLLGPDAVVTPVLGGGRDPGEEVRLVPWGDERSPHRDPDPPWPGRLPAPSPATVLAKPLPAKVLDEKGALVDISARHELTGRPCQVSVDGGKPRRVRAWAGPWATDVRWWTNPCRRARLQVLLEEQTALLLVLSEERWTVEGIYD